MSAPHFNQANLHAPIPPLRASSGAMQFGHEVQRGAKVDSTTYNKNCTLLRDLVQEAIDTHQFPGIMSNGTSSGSNSMARLESFFEGTARIVVHTLDWDPPPGFQAVQVCAPPRPAP